MLLRLCALALAALFSVVVVPLAAVADTPTPSPYPAGSSTITIRFTSNGQPTAIGFNQPFDRISADGVGCPIASSGDPVVLDRVSFVWPHGPGQGQLPECLKGPPTTLKVEFTTTLGPLNAEFQWTGPDVTYDLEVPSPTPSSTPSTAPTGTPAVLPSSGGKEDTPPTLWNFVVYVVLSLTLLAAGGLAIRASRR
jgi:hypothetical protein